jgi:hypothetical protein
LFPALLSAICWMQINLISLRVFLQFKSASNLGWRWY